MEIEGLVAIVTGGAEGIGRAIVERLVEGQAQGVAILDINDVKGRETVAALREKYSCGADRLVFIHCDVSRKEDLESAFAQVKSKFGRLNVVCNNAGIQDEIEWESTVDVNLKGVIRGTYLGVQYMGTKNGGEGGIVINTSSVNGYTVNSVLPIYGATKHAVIAFTRNVAEESMFLENNVQVAAICPGKVDTEIQNKVSCRYPDKFQQMNDEIDYVPLSSITDVVVKLMKHAGNMNGVVCAVLPDDPMKLVDL
ncbi:15-hydroxyprostaglandin dehydrogenase [NAD(+)]-like [Ptychodera flava]|uniref:15-hydroxyprostaglandin dehydrogenase [NAD(+)]-like n=1 Tax=Ptychodera flava TaxID=63121 RepID=UPI00396A38C9